MTRPSERPWRLIGWALIWQVLAVVGSLAGGILIGLGVGYVLAGYRFGPVDQRGFLLGSTACLQLVLVWASWRRARGAGLGRRSTGLGWNTVTRRWLVPVLAGALVLNVAGLVTLLYYAGVRLPDASSEGLVHSFATMGPLPQVILVLLLAVGAPVSEELFFRGWLWTGLRRHWGPVPVMLCTSLLWLCAHLPEGVTRPLVLIPGAIALSLGRHFCDSVRASIVLHCFNNLLAIGLFALALRFA